VLDQIMDFELNETQAMVRETARAFSDRVLRPRAAEFERAERIPSEVLKEMAELGLMGVNVPEALGGSEAGRCPTRSP
jgi:alkylation response protein AidB-like acyl-CoA dehydrogenase